MNKLDKSSTVLNSGFELILGIAIAINGDYYNIGNDICNKNIGWVSLTRQLSLLVAVLD